MESAYEYGSRERNPQAAETMARQGCFWRLMRVFAERQVIPTIYAVGMALGCPSRH